MNKSFRDYMKATYTGPYSATDIVIECDNEKKGIVLIERKYEPFGIAWPGGKGEEGITLEENAIKEAREETGLIVRLENPNRPFLVLSDPDMDPRAHMVTHAYTAKAIGGELKPMEEEDAKNAKIYTLDELAILLDDKEKWAFRHHITIGREYLKLRGYGVQK